MSSELLNALASIVNPEHIHVVVVIVLKMNCQSESRNELNFFPHSRMRQDRSPPPHLMCGNNMIDSAWGFEPFAESWTFLPIPFINEERRKHFKLIFKLNSLLMLVWDFNFNFSTFVLVFFPAHLIWCIAQMRLASQTSMYGVEQSALKRKVGGKMEKSN